MTIVKTDIEYIPLNKLSVVWVQCQRPYRPKWSKEIAENFDPDLFEPIIVTKPNGHGVYHIIEGQHRRHALEMYAARSNKTGRGDNEQAPCRIVEEADPARAAAIWLGINSGRKAVKQIDGFKVAVVAGFKKEVAIDKMVMANGFRVSQDKNKNSIAAVSSLRRVYDLHGPTILNNVLRTIRLMWDGDPQSVSSPVIRGMGIFLNEFGSHVDTKRMIKLAEKWSPFKIRRAAEARKQSSQESLEEAISELLLREYNMKLKDNKLRRKT